MARSSWKIPFVNTQVLLEVTRLHKVIDSLHKLDPSDLTETSDSTVKQANNKMLILSRASVIPRSMLGLSVQVYSGNKYVSFKVEGEHIGRKFGEFAQTRKILAHKEVKKKSLKT